MTLFISSHLPSFPCSLISLQLQLNPELKNSKSVMDPFLDTIPKGRGEEVRKRVRERDASDSAERPTKRSRADTSTLLPPGDEESVLMPEDDTDKYDRKRLQKGLRYVSAAAKRKITLRTQEFLKLHKDAYKAALKGEISDRESRVVVQAMDQVYYSKAFYLEPLSSKNDEDLIPYLKLRRIEPPSVYGVFLGKRIAGNPRATQSSSQGRRL